MLNAGSDDSRFQSMLAEARSGDVAAVGNLLNEYRDYLLLIANQHLDRKIQGKIGGSDIVQESMIAAQRGFARFEGETPDQLMAWLRQILLHDVFEAGRRFKQTAKRQVDREVAVPHGSTAAAPVIDPQNTPKTDAVLKEETQRLRNAMQELPEDYRRVLEMRNWEQLTFSQIGECMNRSEEAARKLWTRAVLQLQRQMN